jgi:hypothetical protein
MVDLLLFDDLWNAERDLATNFSMFYSSQRQVKVTALPLVCTYLYTFCPTSKIFHVRERNVH